MLQTIEQDKSLKPILTKWREVIYSLEFKITVRKKCSLRSGKQDMNKMRL